MASLMGSIFKNCFNMVNKLRLMLGNLMVCSGTANITVLIHGEIGLLSQF